MTRIAFLGITVCRSGGNLKAEFTDWRCIANLPASFMVWAATKQAAFLHGRFVWAHWDVKELEAMKGRLEEDQGIFKIGLQGIEPVRRETLFERIAEKEKQGR